MIIDLLGDVIDTKQICIISAVKLGHGNSGDPGFAYYNSAFFEIHFKNAEYNRKCIIYGNDLYKNSSRKWKDMTSDMYKQRIIELKNRAEKLRNGLIGIWVHNIAFGQWDGNLQLYKLDFDMTLENQINLKKENA